jgi:hypothetical protein
MRTLYEVGYHFKPAAENNPTMMKDGWRQLDAFCFQEVSLTF